MMKKCGTKKRLIQCLFVIHVITNLSSYTIRRSYYMDITTTTAWIVPPPTVVPFIHDKICHHLCLDRSRRWYFRRSLSSTSQSTEQIIQEQQQQARPRTTKTIIKPQRIAIIGSGAVGSYYGGRLWEIGHDVHFLLRNDNYHTAMNNGLHITSVLGDIHIPSQHIQAYPTTHDMMMKMMNTTNIQSNCNHTTTTTTTTFDWVIVALKSSSLDAIPDLILPLLDADTTRVLVIMNGMIENDLIQLMKIKTGQVADDINNNNINNEPLQCCHTWYGGMALICCNRIASCHIDHTYFGLLTAGVASTKQEKEEETTGSGQNRLDITTTTTDRTQNMNEQAFRELFKYTKIDVAYDTSLLRGRWSKMIWNLPFNGLSVAMGGITIDQIVNDNGLRQLAYHIMDETILVANMDLQTRYGENMNETTGTTNANFVPLGDKERIAMMKLSDDMGPYKPSTMLDFIHRRSMEVQYMFRTPLNRAKELNISTPYLETIVLQIEAYQRMYNLF